MGYSTVYDSSDERYNSSGGYGTGGSTTYGYGYSTAYPSKRYKSDWAGVSMADGFKPNVDYTRKMEGQRKFYRHLRDMQRAAAGVANCDEDDFEPLAKAQLSALQTEYPTAVAAHAAAGHTAYLEYAARIDDDIMLRRLALDVGPPGSPKWSHIDAWAFDRMTHEVAERVRTRLLLADLGRVPELSAIELYRLFAAAQVDLSFPSVPSVLSAVIVFGDVLPDWRGLVLHDTTREIFDAVSRASTDHESRLRRLSSAKSLTILGRKWVKDVCRSLMPFLPAPGTTCSPDDPERHVMGEFMHALTFAQPAGDNSQPDPSDEVQPLHEPRPPMLFDPPRGPDRLTRALRAVTGDTATHNGLPQLTGQKFPDRDTLEMLQRFQQAIDAAGGQHSSYEDMRSDLLEQALRGRGFKEGPIEGMPTSGHEVQVPLGENDVQAGEVFDRAVEPTYDATAIAELKAESEPIADALRRTLYPNTQMIPDPERLKTSGAIDAARLPVAEFSSAFYKRWVVNEKADERGRPVLLVAADGSSSLSDDEMRMVKVLTAAWLSAVSRREVQLLAGLYHSDHVQRGSTGPLVQWLHHPRRAPVANTGEAIASVAALPDSGTGAQSDVLSLAYMLDEARAVARGRMVYAIVISDTEWNRCLGTQRSGTQEVRDFFEHVCGDTGSRLHTTLVALGVSDDTGLENIVDKVVPVSRREMKNYSAVAEHIGTYVASLMRERRAMLRQR